MESESGLPGRKPLSVNIARESGGGGGEEMGSRGCELAEEPLSPAAKLFHEPHFNCHIIAMIGVGRRIDVDVMKAGLEATLVRHPRFSSILVLHTSRTQQATTHIGAKPTAPPRLQRTNEQQQWRLDRRRSMESEIGLLRRKPVSVNITRERRSEGGGGGGEEMGGRSGGGMGGGGESMEEGEEEPLSPAAKLFHDPRFNCYIIAMIGFGRRIDVDVVKAGLVATLVRHPRFSSIQVWDEPGAKNPRWVRTEVALDRHLVVPDLDSLTAGPTSDQFVEDYVASLSTSALDPTRPLWELHVLNLRTAEAEATAVFRIHHSLGDGTSLVSLLLACTRKSSDPGSLPTLPTARRPAARRHVLLRAWAALALAWATLVDVLLFFATVAFLRDTATPLKAAGDVRSHPKRLVHRAVSLDDIKAVKNVVGCTINDVLLGVTSAGLSRHLSRRYSKGGDSNEKKKSIRLRTTLAVNIRPVPGIQALAKMMEGESGGARWGNSIGYIILPLPIVDHDDPLDYVRTSKAMTERKKNSLEAIFANRSITFTTKVLGSKAAAALSLKVFSQTTLTYSNIVGPVEEIGFYGHPIVYLAPGVFGLPHAITLHFQSYMNKMKIVVAADELVVPNPHELLDDLVESLRLIKDAATATS